LSTYTPYPTYKPSGVEWLGNVPKHWEVKRLRFSVRINPSKQEVSLPKDAEVSFLPMQAVGENGSLDLELTRPIEDVETGYTYFSENDVTFAKITPCFENGKGALMKGLVNGIGFGTTELTVIRPCSYLDSRYLYLLTTSHPFRRIGESFMYGAGGQKRVPDDFVRDFKIAIPPLKEQHTICNFLDRETAKIDTLMAKKQRFIELLKEKRTALISRAVTKGLNPKVKLKLSGIPWLGDVPEHWETWKIAHGFKVIGSGTTPPTDEIEWYDGTIPWVTTGELRENIICETEKEITDAAVQSFSALKIFPKGSLLIAMYGATIGRLGILGVEATTNQACCAMFGGSIFTTKFVYYWMYAFKDSIILLASGGGQPNISQEKIKSLLVPCPSMPEQEQIVSFLDIETRKIEKLISKVESAIEKLKEYRQSLITSMVLGKTNASNKPK